MITDEITISTADAFFDWIYDHPIISVPNDKRIAISLWLRIIDRPDAQRIPQHAIFQRQLTTAFPVSISHRITLKPTKIY